MTEGGVEEATETADPEKGITIGGKADASFVEPRGISPEIVQRRGATRETVEGETVEAENQIGSGFRSAPHQAIPPHGLGVRSNEIETIDTSGL